MGANDISEHEIHRCDCLTKGKIACRMCSVTELQKPERPATGGVPAGAPFLHIGGYYGKICPYA